MVYDLLEHGAERQTVMSTEGRGEAKDGYAVSQHRRLDVFIWTLNGRIKTRENAPVPELIVISPPSTLLSRLQEQLTKGPRHGGPRRL